MNIRKSATLCINTSPEIMQGLQEKCLTTPTTIKHLGTELGPRVEETLGNILNKIDSKAMKQRVMVTAPQIDILHRATLINSHLQQRLHGITSSKKDVDPLYKEIQLFFWSKNCQQRNNPEKKTCIQEKTLCYCSLYKSMLEI
jgi:hypothetical protein